MKHTVLFLSLVLASAAPLPAQAPQQTSQQVPPAEMQDKPLPDIPTLMHEVEAHQKQIDEIRKNYIYHAVETTQELDGHGHLKKVETEEHEVFYIHGQHIERVLKRNGKDLEGNDLKKEQERVDKQVAKARQAKDGEKTDPNGNAVMSVSRLLELGTVSNPRRLMMNGRSTIAFDFAGNTRTKTHNMSEGVMKDLSGTVWIDEADHQVTRMQARFEENFHIGGGLLANIQKGTNFTFEQAHINNEVWLPTSMDGVGSARILLVKGFSGTIHVAYFDYRKYKADVTILPGATPVTE